MAEFIDQLDRQQDDSDENIIEKNAAEKMLAEQFAESCGLPEKVDESSDLEPAGPARAELSPKMAEGVALFKKGDIDQAKASFRDAILEHGESPYSITRLAEEVAGKDADKAEDIYKAAVLAADSVKPSEMLDKVRGEIEELKPDFREFFGKLDPILRKYGPGDRRKLIEKAVAAGDQDVIRLIEKNRKLQDAEKHIQAEMTAPVLTRYMLGLFYNKLGKNDPARKQFKDAAEIIDGGQIMLQERVIEPLKKELEGADMLAAEGKVITPSYARSRWHIDQADRIKERFPTGLISSAMLLDLPVDLPIPDCMMSPDFKESRKLAVEHLVDALDQNEPYTKHTVGKLKQEGINLASTVAQDLGVTTATLAIARQILARTKGKGLAATVAAYGGSYLIGGLMREGTDSISAWALGTPEHSITQNMIRQSIATTAVIAAQGAYGLKNSNLAKQLGADDLQALATRAGVKLSPGAKGLAGYEELVAAMEAKTAANLKLQQAGQAAEATIARGSRFNYPYRLANPYGRINLGPTATLRGLKAHVNAQKIYGNMMTGAAFGSIYSGGHAFNDLQRKAVNPATGKPYTFDDALERTLKGTSYAALVAGLVPSALAFIPGSRQAGQMAYRTFLGASEAMGVKAAAASAAADVQAIAVPALLGGAHHVSDGLDAASSARKWSELLKEAEGIKTEKDGRGR